jgi:hypothetical protein
MSVHPIRPKAKKMLEPAPLREEHLQVIRLVLAFGAFTPRDDDRIRALAYCVWAIFVRTPFAEDQLRYLEKHAIIAPQHGVIPWRLTPHGHHIAAQIPVRR